MNRRELIRVIKNYNRNKKRIEEIKRDVFSISGIDYSNSGGNDKNRKDTVFNSVYKFEMNKERKELQGLIDSVDRLNMRLTERQTIVYKLYFIQDKTVKAIESNGVSQATAYREIDNILEMLDEEIKMTRGNI